MQKFKIIDDRHLKTKLFFKSEAEEEAQAKEIIAGFVSNIIKQFFQQRFQLVSIDSSDTTIEGQFYGRRTYYDYKISSQGNFSYVESSTQKISDHEDAKKCRVGKSCGDTCIEKGDICEGKVKRFNRKSFQAANTALKQKKNTGKLGGAILTLALLGSAVLASATAKLEQEITKGVDQVKKTSRTASEAAVEKKVRGIESKIKNNDYESLYMIHPKTGEVVFEKKGGATEVSITPQEMLKTAGMISLHNHPPDVSFSPPDISNAMILQASSMRVISSEREYILNPPKAGWNRRFYSEKWQPAYKRNSKIILDSVVKDYRAGKISSEQADYQYFSEVNRLTAKQTGVEYIERPLSPSSKKKIQAKKDSNLLTGTVLNPVPSTVIDFQLLGLCKRILNRSSITVARMHLMPKVSDGKITGYFWATNQGYYSYSIAPNGKIDYRQIKTTRQGKSRLSARKDTADQEIKEDAPRAGRRRTKKQFECSPKSTPCKGICIPKSHTCRDEVNLSVTEQRKIESAIATVDKYSGRSLRELQKEGAARGVYRTNHKRKAELIQTLKALDQNPQSQENLRRTLNNRKKNRDRIVKAAPKDLQKTYKSLQTVSKVYRQNPDQAGLIIAAGLLGVSSAIASRVRDNYKDGLNESAEMALSRAQRVPVANTRKNDMLFAVGGYAGLDSRGERMRDLILAPQDNTSGEQWFGKNNHIIPFNHSEFNVENPGINKRNGNGDYNPAYLGFVAKSSFGQYLQNHRRGRNEAAVDLAAQMYAYGNRYPKANLNVVAHGSGGNVTDEATEILGRMRRLKSNKPNGQELTKRLNIVRLGSNYFGHTNDKRWNREVNHRTISSRKDPFSFLPKKRPQWISSVKGGEVDDYLKNPEVREKLRESFNYYSSSMKGSVIASQRRQETRKAVGEVLGIINPGFGTIWNQIGRIQDKARDNPTAAAAFSAALVTGVSVRAYKNAQKRHTQGINEGAKVAQNSAKNIRVDNPNNRSNVTIAVGGTGESAQDIIDNLPPEIKGSGATLKGGKTHVINAEEYGISSADVPSYLKPGTRPYYAYLAANGFGGELKKGVLGDKVDPEAVQLAALLFAHGQKNYQNNRNNYQLNMIASGDGALKARAAMEILNKMGGRGQAIARNVQLASLGTPAFGITNENPGTATNPKYISREVSFMGTQDFFNLFPDRRTATTFRPNTGHGAASYLKDESVIKNISDVLYPPPKRKSKPKKKKAS